MTYLPLARGRPGGTTASQCSRRHGLNSMARPRHGGRLRAGDGPTLRRHRGGVGARTARRGLPLLTITGSARRPLRTSLLRNIDVGLRRTLEDFVKTSRHPLGVIAITITVVAVVFIGSFLLGFPPSASTSRGVSRALAARGSSSSSFLSPLWNFVSPRTRAFYLDRRRPPSPEASRTERRSSPVKKK